MLTAGIVGVSALWLVGLTFYFKGIGSSGSHWIGARAIQAATVITILLLTRLAPEPYRPAVGAGLFAAALLLVLYLLYRRFGFGVVRNVGLILGGIAALAALLIISR